MGFLNAKNIHDFCINVSCLAEEEILACMRHILVAPDTALHCQPTALEDVRTP